MTLNQLIFRIASVYPNAAILDYWDMTQLKPRRSTDGGDYIAKFITQEIGKAYEPEAGDEQQLASAVTALQHGADRLQAAAHALANMSREGQAGQDEMMAA
jgi:hypothetical protein